jgi:hypothetical protein
VGFPSDGACRWREAPWSTYNFFPAITDTLIPLYLLGLLYAYWRAGGLEGKLRPER